jgi:hypothetical protein
VAIIAANACVDYLSLFAVSPSLQCVWVRCDKALIGFGDLVCTAYINPQSQAFTLAHVTDSFSSLLDELACATQVAPYFLLCGDFNPKVGGLSEVPHAHGGLLMAHPALQLARRCECRGVNAAGRLLIDYASAAECVLGTGRVLGDAGQATIVGSPDGC